MFLAVAKATYYILVQKSDAQIFKPHQTGNPAFKIIDVALFPSFAKKQSTTKLSFCVLCEDIPFPQIFDPPATSDPTIVRKSECMTHRQNGKQATLQPESCITAVSLLSLVYRTNGLFTDRPSPRHRPDCFRSSITTLMSATARSKASTAHSVNAAG
jgi:hypothetical protein